jgi:IG-like fold at C-terminal of FixG, putative oxidoreductase
LMNQTEWPQRIELSAVDLPGAEAQASVRLLGPVQDQQVHVSVRLSAEQASRLRGQTLSMRLQVASRSDKGSSLISEPTTFIVPR